MLAIRLQRLGRKDLPVYRLAVQEARRHPSSGRVVAYVGNYNPHTKALKIDKEKASFYLKNGAQPSDRVVRLLKIEKVELPAWIKDAAVKKASIKQPDKLRKNQPKEEAADSEAAAPAEADTANAEQSA